MILPLFSELLAAARPGTYFLLTVPADQGLWSEHDKSFGHYRRYDLHRFEQIWQGLPVTPLLASYYNTRLYPGVWAGPFPESLASQEQWAGRHRFPHALELGQPVVDLVFCGRAAPADAVGARCSRGRLSVWREPGSFAPTASRRDICAVKAGRFAA